MEKPKDTKKYYWIKLKDSFMTSDTVDFLMSQKNGAEYVVLYQMLCLKTINTDGELARRIGEVLIPFDAEKIQRDAKHFKIDTIIIALELYKKLGLIYEQENGVLTISNFNTLVGSETSKAEMMRRLRERRKAENQRKKAVTPLPERYPDVTQEIEIRDKSIEIDIKDRNKDDEEDNYNMQSVSKKDGSPPPPLKASDFTYKDLVAIYKQYAPTLYGKEFDGGINDDYKNAQELFLAVDMGDFDATTAATVFSKAEASAWLVTDAKGITLDWLIKKRKMILGGRYDNSEPKEKKDDKQEKHGVTRKLW